MKVYRMILAVVLAALICTPAALALNVPTPELVFPSVHSSDLNPALLAMSPYNVDLRLDPLALGIYTNTWTVGYVLDNINGYWDEAKKDELMGMVQGDALGIGTDINAGLYIGVMNFALSSKVKGNVDVGIDKNLFKLALKGTEWDIPNNNSYNLTLDKSYAKANVLLDTSMSYAFPAFKGWYMGVGAHHLLGAAFAELTDSNFEVDIEFSNEFQVQGLATAEVLYANPLDGALGNGFAVDLGVWKQLRPNLGVGASLTNLGQTYWTGVKRAYFEEEKTLNVGQFLEDPENFSADFEFGEPVFDELYNGDGLYTQTNPITFNASAHYQPFKRLQLVANVGVKTAPVTHMELSAGTRLTYVPFLPLTLSASYDTQKGVPSVAGSLGLHIFGWEMLNLTISDLKLIQGSAKEVKIGLNTGIRF